MSAALARTFALFFALAFAAPPAWAEPRRCSDHDPQRNVYWGDLHVHTALSMDAYIMDTRLRPDDAYRFATGEAVALPPLDAEGRGTRPFRIDRPLDFAAVTDHAHSLGGTRLCTDPESPAFATGLCERYRRPFRPRSLKHGAEDIIERIDSLRSEPLCGPGGARCAEAATAAWQEIREAAARWNSSAPECSFTTFVAYEYTATPNMTKIHRNVIFRNATVPELPVTYYDEPTDVGLWRRLQSSCNDAGTGCDALAIPHNPNLSNGNMFTIGYPEGSSREEQVELATLRAQMEPVVEMSQIKGDSECRNGLWKVLGSDEFCDFEKRRDEEAPHCKGGTGNGALAKEGCRSRLDFSRYALVEGLREADRIGVNPLAFGQIAATDIHTGTPGPVRESQLAVLGGRPPAVGNGNGGLAAVWAEENTREALFQALRRREVYGTSGPRMRVRFFGGWGYPETLCDDEALVARGYAEGVPMGGDLPPRPESAAGPVFVVSALRDPGTPDSPGTPLQRIQIVKGWADDAGNFHQQIVDAAGGANDSSVDLATCRTRGAGADALCGVWRDPAFDPQQRAVYYARVLENPTCRFSTWQCKDLTGDARFAACDDPGIPKTIQERAWTSPIWYAP